MTMHKTIFLDVDGTLLDYRGRLPASAVQAVRAARANGHKIYLCTGRSRSGICPALWEVGFDGLICGGGVYLESGGKIIYSETIAPKWEKAAVDWLEEHEIGYYVECPCGLFASKWFVMRTAQLLGDASAAGQEKVRRRFPRMQYNSLLYRNDAAKISFCLCPDLLEQAKERFDEALRIGTWTLTGKHPEFGELSVIGADKAKAAARLLELMGTDREDTLAFGDSPSDLSILQYCGVGIAMASGDKFLLDRADYVAPPVEQDGLARAFAHFALAEETIAGAGNKLPQPLPLHP